jgi:hypothetical protein
MNVCQLSPVEQVNVRRRSSVDSQPKLGNRGQPLDVRSAPFMLIG